MDIADTGQCTATISGMAPQRLYLLLALEHNMNRHLTDARYYLKRAGNHAKMGIVEEAEPVVTRVRTLRGADEEDEESEPSRIERVRFRLTAASRRAIGGVRKRIKDFRDSRRKKQTA